MFSNEVRRLMFWHHAREWAIGAGLLIAGMTGFLAAFGGLS